MGTRFTVGARARRTLPYRDGKLEAIRSVPVFSLISAADAKSIGRLTELAVIKSGSVLCSPGERCREFVVVLSGRLAATRQHGPTSLLRPGDHVGAAEVIDGAPMGVTVRAATDSTVLLAGRRQFEALLAEVEPFRRAIFTDLARRAREDHTTPWTAAPLRRLAWN